MNENVFQLPPKDLMFHLLKCLAVWPQSILKGNESTFTNFNFDPDIDSGRSPFDLCDHDIFEHFSFFLLSLSICAAFTDVVLDAVRLMPLPSRFFIH